MSRLTLSSFDLGDVCRLAEIDALSFSTPYKAEDFSALYGSSYTHLLTARADGRILGYISFTVIVDECQIINIAVDPQERCRGVGSFIMEGLFSFGKEKGVKKYFLEARESNAPAISLYKKYGFSQVGVSKNHYSQPREDAVLMNLELEE